MSERDALIAEYRRKAEPVGAIVGHVATSPLAAARIAEVRSELGVPGVVLSAELAEAAPRMLEALTALGVPHRVQAGDRDAVDHPFGIGLAHQAIAETGSVMLAEGSLGDRVVSMATLANLVVIPSAALVPSLDETVAALRAVANRPGGGYATLVTGPSRTADIEMSLTIGVQGPKQIWMLFVDELD